MAVHEGQKRGIFYNPATIIASSFLAAILLGSLLLCLPIATTSGDISFIDALFTATSATCVTGLVVVDTGSYFTTFGQFVILALIQLGGLGIMTLSSFFVVLLGKKLSMRNKIVVQDALDYYDVNTLSRLLKTILLLTAGIELMGALPLFFRWQPEMGTVKAIYYAVFHAVSAFCNAGFTLFPNSLIPFREEITVNLVIALLIILGGIGFVVLLDLRRYLEAKRKSKGYCALSMQTKVILSSTAILILVGMVSVLLLEWNNTLQPLSLPAKLLASFFASVTTRTAGFNTLPTGLMNISTLMVFILLMFIGASPGSTGGGVKTTTLAIFLASMRAMISGKERVSLFKRTIPRKEIRNAIIIIGLSSLLVVLSLLALLIIEGSSAKDMLHAMFEVTSAFGTVGLSTGLTPQLSPWGRLLITAVMFIGRTGPLTLALAVSSGKSPPLLKYPEGRIMVG